MKYMNDKWILVIGIPLVGFIMPLVFNDFSLEFLFSEGYRNAVMSMATTIAIWLGVRQIVVFLWNRYPWEVHPFKHLIYEILMVTSYTMLIGYASYLIATHTDFVNLDKDIPIVMSAVITLLITYFITSLHEAWFFYNQWNISLLKAKALEKENLQSQYETLKSQINPHFLFNTLNTLSALIEENQGSAVNFVEKTADFLRSILSMKDKEVINLEEEIAIIQTFYYLQKERYGDNLQLKIEIPDEILTRKVPPLSLQMLVENAIKHNVISSEYPLIVSIKADKDYIVVRNNLQKKNPSGQSNGIGLENIRNRYNFLSGKKVIINEDSEMFEVKLPLLQES